jgi:hypothetical protein
MRRFTFYGAVLVASLCSTLPAAAVPADDAAATVQALYHHAMTHFGFDPDIVRSAKPWLTPGLYARLWKKANAPVPKGDAPDIEGDVFMDAQDVPTRFVVLKAATEGDKATVAVNLFWSAEEERHFNVLLERVGGAWKVSDVDYGQDGKLSDLLK